MTIALVNDRRARQDTKASTPPALATTTRREGREWGAAYYRIGLRWPVEEDSGGLLLQMGCGMGAVEFLAGRGRDVIAVLRAQNSLARCSRCPLGGAVTRRPRPLCRTVAGSPGRSLDAIRSPAGRRWSGNCPRLPVLPAASRSLLPPGRPL